MKERCKINVWREVFWESLFWEIFYKVQEKIWVRVHYTGEWRCTGPSDCSLWWRIPKVHLYISFLFTRETPLPISPQPYWTVSPLHPHTVQCAVPHSCNVCRNIINGLRWPASAHFDQTTGQKKEWICSFWWEQLNFAGF